jgi:protein-S-isoprenylcysteine O-methyltransferase Ste14
MESPVNQRPFRIPPAAVFVTTGLLMWAAAVAASAFEIAIPGRRIAAGLIGGVGAAVALAGVIGLRLARTTVNPIRPAAAERLVVGGIYRHTRNPIYLGMLVLLIAWGVLLANPLAWILVGLFFAVMDRHQIVREERALAAAFGDAYRDYAARVGRWVNVRRS